MKIQIIYIAAVIAAGAAYTLHASNIPNPDIALSDLALCEEAGNAFFINKDHSKYQQIVNEIETRRKEHRFTINSRSCGLFGLADAVNAPQPKQKQIDLALKGMRHYSQTLAMEQQKEESGISEGL